MHSLIRRFALLAVTVGALAAFPGAASAATCNHDGDGPRQDNDPSLVDAGGFFWDVGTTGMVDDGYHDSSERSDAFDLFGGLLASADNGQTFHEYQNPDANSCVVSQNGHQLDYPEDTTTILTLGMSRSVYVAPNGLPFLRYVDTLRNFTDDPETVLYRFGGNFGSDNSTTVAGTSSGDNLITDADSWADTFEDPISPLADPTVTTVWDGTTQPRQRATVAGRFSPFNPGFAADSEQLGVEYTVTLAPGQTKRFMHVIALRLTTEDQASAAAAIAAQPDELIAGLSDAEQDNVQNWSFDRDQDGVLDRADNCPSAANSGQEDQNRDAVGDRCDDDIDGDGIDNGVEGSLRTDPRNADSDNDGKSDNVDSCPTIAAQTADGCPAAVALPQSAAADKTAPVVSLTVPRKVSLKTVFRKGIALKLGSNEPAAFEVEVATPIKSARAAQVGDLTVSAKALGLGAGTRNLTLTIAKKFRKALTVKSRLRVKVTATDAAGNRTVSSTVVRFKR